MLALILSHRHQIRLIQQDVRRHQHRVGEQSGGDIVRVLSSLGLELGHAAQLAELGIAAQDPAQLRMLGHMALNKHDVFLGIQTTGNILGQLVDAAPAQGGGILPHGDGMHVHNAVQAVVLILQVHPVFDGTHIGAQRQLSGGLDAAENSLFALISHFLPLIVADFASVFSSCALILPRLVQKINGICQSSLTFPRKNI